MAPNLIAQDPNIRSRLSLIILTVLIWGSIATDSFIICNHLFFNSKSLEKAPLNKLSCLFARMTRVIDSHVHVWNNGAVPFTYNGIDAAPPSDLVSAASPTILEALMRKGNVGGAVIIQPINYKYDHSFLKSIMKDSKFRHRFKFVCLFNPNLDSIVDGESYLEELCSAGFRGVRWNPYLWPTGQSMSGINGLAWFKKAGSLGMPVSIMCFKGLSLHYEDIVKLLQHAPETQVIIDHFGFYFQGGDVDELAWSQLISLAAFPQVHVKVSALFRVSSLPWPHRDLDSRTLALVDRFGANRLLFGSDFPFVQQQARQLPDAVGHSNEPSDFKGGASSTPQKQSSDEEIEYEEPYVSYVRAPSLWQQCQRDLLPEQWDYIMGRTAENLYGHFEV